MAITFSTLAGTLRVPAKSVAKPQATTWLRLMTLNDRVTLAAAEKDPEAGREAVIEQGPIARGTIWPLTMEQFAVPLVTVTGRPELVVAGTARGGSLISMSDSSAKVMVCTPLVTLNERDTGRAAA